MKMGASKHDGKRYRIGKEPVRMAHHNEVTWRRLREQVQLNGELHYQTLVKLAVGHVSGSKGHPHPQSFVRYCIRSGWLVARCDP